MAKTASFTNSALALLWSLRNKFHFSEAHGSLRSYSHEPQKNEIHLIFTLCFYIVFVHYLWDFDFSLANKREEKL